MPELIQSPSAWTVAVAACLLALALAGLLGRELIRRYRAERAAQDARERLVSLSATMREGVVAYDLERRLLFVNPAFERLTGFPLEDLRDQEFLQYIHPEDRAALLEEWDRLANGGSLRDQEYRIVTSSGQERWSSSIWEPMRDEQGAQIGYLGTEFDITERKLAEAEMRQDGELFQAVLEVQQAVAAAGLDSRTVTQVIAERTQLLTGACGAAAEIIEERELVPQVHAGLKAPPLPVEDSVSGLCLRTGEPQRLDDILHEPGTIYQPYRELGIRSVLVVPLRDEHRVLGVLRVISRRAAAFSDRDLKALRLLGGLMGAAIRQATAYEARRARLEERTRALQESEQRFKRLVDAAHEGIWTADARGLITYVNPRMTELLGYHDGALLGRSVIELVDTGSRPTAQVVVANALSGAPQHQDLRFRRKDGGELWTLVSASPIVGRDGASLGTVGILTDITERKRAEERLHRSAERLAGLHDMEQAIFATGSPTEIGQVALSRVRKVIPCDRCSVVVFDFERGEAELIAGYAGAAPLSSGPIPLSVLSPPEVLRSGRIRCLEDITTLEQPPPFLRELVDDGMRSVLSVPLMVDGMAIGELTLASATPARFEPEHREIAAELAAPLAVAMRQARLREERDRETTRLERQLGEHAATLREVQTELETLLHSISHDLRAPLRHIGGFAQLLLDDYGPRLDPASRHYAERIRQGTGEMATVLDQILLLSRIGRQELKLEPVDLRAVVEEVIAQIGPAPGEREVEWDVKALPVVRADPSLVRMALSQLLSNALKFSRPRERAIIRIQPIERDELVGLAVQDNGVGFRMAYAGKLFKLFQRLHREDEFEGSGGGLAIVRRIAEKHGGQVWAEGREGAGATFCLTFAPADG